jgi:penicillin-binding protein 2
MVVLGLAFFRVQVVRSSSYALTAESNRLRPLDLPAPRGTIYDREGRIIADNVPGYAITLLPASPDTLVATLDRMAGVLPELRGRMQRLLREAEETRGITPLVVDPDATYEEVAALEERRAEFPGVYIESRPQRRYRGGAAMGHVMGYLAEITAEELESEEFAADHYEQGMTVGKLGVEREYERLLQGRRGVRYVEVDARRRIVGDFAGVQARPATPGQDITLSIDLELQEWIHRIFPDSMHGAVVALDPSDGSVLALYSAPSFDPNLFVGGIDDATWLALNDPDAKPLYNRAVLGRYAPASTWKLATAGIALDLGLVEPDEHMPVRCNGGLRFGNTWFGCWNEAGHGDIDLLEAVATSCNTYFYQVGLRIGLQRLLDEAGRLGFRSTCGIDLPREEPGIFPAGPEYWERVWGYRPTEGEVPSLSIGQGANQQTPLRMAQFYLALARDGSAPAPRLFAGSAGGAQSDAGTEGTGGAERPGGSAAGWSLDLSPEALAVIREGMRRVTAPGGTAHYAALEHWDLYGKSGSGQNPLSLQGLADTHAWFAGMAGPRGGDPEVVVVALVEYGGGGSAVAAPIVAKTADHYLRRKYDMPIDTIQTLLEHIRTGGWPEWAYQEREAASSATDEDDGPVTPGAPVGRAGGGGGA